MFDLIISLNGMFQIDKIIFSVKSIDSLKKNISIVSLRCIMRNPENAKTVAPDQMMIIGMIL